MREKPGDFSAHHSRAEHRRAGDFPLSLPRGSWSVARGLPREVQAYEVSTHPGGRRPAKSPTLQLESPVSGCARRLWQETENLLQRGIMPASFCVDLRTSRSKNQGPAERVPFRKEPAQGAAPSAPDGAGRSA